MRRVLETNKLLTYWWKIVKYRILGIFCKGNIKKIDCNYSYMYEADTWGLKQVEARLVDCVKN